MELRELLFTPYGPWAKAHDSVRVGDSPLILGEFLGLSPNSYKKMGRANLSGALPSLGNTKNVYLNQAWLFLRPFLKASREMASASTAIALELT